MWRRFVWWKFTSVWEEAVYLLQCTWMRPEYFSQTSLNMCQVTRRHIQEDSTLRCENKSRRPSSVICLFYRSNNVFFVRLRTEAYCLKRSDSMSLITVLFRSDLVSLYTISIWQEWTAWGHNGAGTVLVFLTEKKEAKSVGQDDW